MQVTQGTPTRIKVGQVLNLIQQFEFLFNGIFNQISRGRKLSVWEIRKIV